MKIVVLNDVLRDQMLDDINRVLPSNPYVSVVEISQLAAIQKGNFIYLLDECDAMLKEHLISFRTNGKKTEVYGLAAVYLSCAHSIWFSATLNRNDRKLLYEVFGMV